MANDDPIAKLNDQAVVHAVAQTDANPKKSGGGIAGVIARGVTGAVTNGISGIAGNAAGAAANTELNRREQSGPLKTQDITLEDGQKAKVVSNPATGLVVTGNQTSITFDADHNGTKETVVTATKDGKLTVGNAEKGTNVTITSPQAAGMAAMIGNMGATAVGDKKVDDAEFNSLHSAAQMATSLVPPPTPPSAPAPAGKTKPHGRHQ